MKILRAVVIDDEKPARDRLRAMLERVDAVRVVGEAVNGSDAVGVIRSLKPDLIFLDVHMPLLSGFQVLEQLESPPAVIFTTAYDEYALQAFDVHAVDYLLKPYNKDRLEKSVSRALSRLDTVGTDAGLDSLMEEYREQHPYLERMTIRSGKSYRVEKVEDAECFVASDGLVFFVTERERLFVEGTLKHLESRLDPRIFMRIHRNAIANLSRVRRVIPLGKGRLAVEFPSGSRLDVGRTRTDAFRRAFQLSQGEG